MKRGNLRLMSNRGIAQVRDEQPIFVEALKTSVVESALFVEHALFDSRDPA